jgi:hypothetical protein
MNDSTTTARKGSVRTTVAVVAAAGLLSGMALAAVQGSAKMQGNIGRGQFVAYWSPVSGPSIGLDMPEGTTDANLTTADSGRTLVFPSGLELFEEQTAIVGNGAVGLAVKGSVPTKNGRAGYVSGFAGTIGKGWEVTLTSGCAAPVAAPAIGASYTGVAPVTLEIKAVPDAAAVDPLSLDALAVVITDGTAPVGHTCAPVVGS